MSTYLEASTQLFGSYLHQDWAEEFDTVAAAVRAMMESEPKGALAAAAIEIRRLLSSDLSDAELAGIMTDEVGCYFDPRSKGKTYREWLAEILQMLEPAAR